MTDYILSSPRQADEEISRFFFTDRTGRLEVIEETAFHDATPLNLGSIVLSSLENNAPSLRAAVRNGSFEWNIPEKTIVLSDLQKLLDIERLEKKVRDSATARLVRIMDDMSEIAVRLGLAYPRFDALAVAGMPFQRPATVVADTSGVLQGALTFVAHHLHPMARLKIPAVLHMEVINQADRFLKARRTTNVRRDIVLAEHLQSQSAQRVLLRLELREDTEVERNLLIGDPLRSAFREDRDPDLREMNVNVAIKSYVDRMILESARQHQAYASPGHPVHLLTGDQGLARMAIAEGIKPLFFKKAKADQLFGLKLTGANFSPFTGRILSTPVSAVLWELATAFGRARLVRDSDGASIEVTAIDKDLSWSAFHSHDDLLWFRSKNLPTIEEGDIRNDPPSLVVSTKHRKVFQAPVAQSAKDRRSKIIAKPASLPQAVNSRLSKNNRAGVPFYRINVKGLINLISMLAKSTSMDDEMVMDAVDLRHPTGLAEYKRFLLSGKLIESGIENEARNWVATDSLVSLGSALQERDLPRVLEGLSATPSFAGFVAQLSEHSRANETVNLPIPERVLPSYLAMGEVVAVGISIPNEGYYATLYQPDLSTFVKIALERYAELAPDKGWVATGEWLEALARKDGIHPVRARDNLQEAASGGLIRRWTEGSTTDTRHDDHTVRLIVVEAGHPRVDKAYLYRGDFLMPDKSSSSLRLEALPL